MLKDETAISSMINKTASDVRKNERRSVWRKIKPYAFVAPALSIFLIFSIYPAFRIIDLSLYQWNLVSPAKDFVGFQNYVNLFHDPEFFETLRNTILYTVLTVGLSLSLSLFLAIYLKNDTRINRFLQRLIFSPYIVSLASISFLWLWLMNSDVGFLNYIISLFGIGKVDWLGNPHVALFSLVLISVWKTAGYNTLIVLASLQVIPKHLYEAASLDHANQWRTFRKITLPMISPTLFFITIVDIISSFKVFETIQIMTDGGPQNATNTLVFAIYEYGFKFYKIGYASSIGVVLLVIISIFTILYFRGLASKVHYQ
jgi:sn-glycerol 3-phosphate transport system permease protein